MNTEPGPAAGTLSPDLPVDPVTSDTADFEVRQFAWELRQRRARRSATPGMYPGAGLGRYGAGLTVYADAQRSRHSYRHYSHGHFVGWRSHTKKRTGR